MTHRTTIAMTSAFNFFGAILIWIGIAIFLLA